MSLATKLSGTMIFVESVVLDGLLGDRCRGGGGDLRVGLGGRPSSTSSNITERASILTLLEPDISKVTSDESVVLGSALTCGMRLIEELLSRVDLRC